MDLSEEIADPTGWITASSDLGGECLEAKHLSDGRVALRDTEQPDVQPWILRRAVWDTFITGAKNGLFD
ncbi:DUF397 domain-containing protein [Spongiactinospora sp. TRM90649]|uniref:DUF397 domain-containing protein n=1 Tax=Spongiactinospora sp. TRM90649 TaxID=3031114 RepID=UPI0023FA2805|nr:DUF397 domain-containing protein [Spongiactinospora sp. TRM90649]MDF5759210.1 DUF397 domain-containing protein [Spongiactinospora sp. TRM90649]